MEKKKEKKSSVILVTILIIVLLVAAVLGGFLAGASYIASKSLEKKKEVKEELNKETISEEKSNVLSAEEALKKGNELWEYAFATYWGKESVWKRHEGEVNEAGGRELVCDTTAEEVKKKYSSDFKYIGDFGENGGVDDFVPSDCFNAGNRGGDQMYKTTTLKVKNVEDDKIVFDATSEYCGSSFCHESNETEKTVIKDFVIVKENDQWLINSFYLPN